MKAVKQIKVANESKSTDGKASTDENGDVYLASMGTQSEHDAWLIESGASYHITPHRDWFLEYEEYEGGDVFIGDDSTTRIVGRGQI